MKLFETSREVGSIPLVLVLGKCALGVRDLLSRLLTIQAFKHSAVISTRHEFLESLRNARLIELPSLASSAQDDCLCCGMHSGLGDALRQLFFDALSDRTRPLDRVVIESNSIETAQLSHTLKHTPFLGQRYFHQITLRVVSASLLQADGLASLKGLEPANNRSRQFLIVLLSGLESRIEKCSDSISFESLLACATLIEQELPYQKVFFFDEIDDISLTRDSDAQAFCAYFGLNEFDK